MKKKIFVFVFFYGLLSTVSGQTFSEQTEIDSLVREADAVVLEHNCIMELTGKNSADYKVTGKILIKNKNADKYCRLTLFENEIVSTEELDAKITNILGEEIKELDSDDIFEAEVSPGYEFYSGEKVKSFKLEHHTYPFIFVYSFERELNSLFSWPDYYPQGNIPVLHSSYTLTLPSEIKFNYKLIGDIAQPEIKSNSGNVIYKWDVSKLPPKIDEDYMPPENEIQVGVRFSPSTFKIDDYAGSLQTWNDFAVWYNDLSRDRYSLPWEAVDEIKALVDSVQSDEEKIKILYNFLQTKTRYVAIEPGINGWQPHPAKDVYKNLYGDCKDLSTFMIAILKEAGIKSYPALARTKDQGKLDEDFPWNGFNHCIVYVPNAQDTLWLECTNSYTDLEDTPYGIEGISVLAIDENGGKLITTPQKSADKNKWIAKLSGQISPRGDLEFNAGIKLTGNLKNHIKSRLTVNSNKEDILYLKNRFGIYYSNLYIDDYKGESKTEEYDLNFSGNYKKFVSLRGKRLFVNPTIFNRETLDDLPEEKVEDRKFPVFYNFPYTYMDTVEITIPGKYKLEALPNKTVIENSFGNYCSEFNFSDDKLIYTRKIEILENRIPLEEYENYYNFMKSIIKADKSKAVFKK